MTCRKKDCSSAAQCLLGRFGVMGKAVFVRRGQTLLDTGITGKQTVHLLAQGKEKEKCVSRDVASFKPAMGAGSAPGQALFGDFLLHLRPEVGVGQHLSGISPAVLLENNSSPYRL